MNPDVIQFQCNACHTTLTVPAQMAGVTGPCPACGQTITSPAATPAPTFGGGFPAPASMMAPSASAPMPRPASYGGPQGGLGGAGTMGGPAGPSSAMPLPHGNAPHLTPHIAGPGSHAMPQGGFLGQRPPSPMPEPQHQPPWQAPGLGQTMMAGGAESHPQPPAAPIPQSPAGGSFLPPRRLEGQSPNTGGAQASNPASPWGAGAAPGSPSAASAFPAPRSAAAAGLGSSMPNAANLPPVGASGMGGGAFSGREMPGNSGGPISGELPMPAGKARRNQRQRLPNKPRRSSNFLMFVLALLFLGGAVAAAGWLFREPLLKLGHRYMPGLTEKILSFSNPPAPIREQNLATLPAPPAPAEATAKPKAPPQAEAKESPAPTPPVVAAPSSLGGFNPDQAAPAKAQSARGDLTALPSATDLVKPETGVSTKPSLVEVPSKSVMAGVARNSEGAAPATSSTDVKLEVTPEGRPAADALLKFLNAANVRERLRYTLAADFMQPLMERYYSVNEGGPIHVDSISLVRLDKKPEIGGGAHALFGIESKGWEFPVPVMLEEGPDGFRVDWLSFVEFKDRLLERFFKAYQEGPARFHVGITRTHYFENVVPNADNKDAFRISPAPPNPYQTTIFVDKDSVLGRELRDKIPWGCHVWAIVELEWIRLGNQQWVELAAVPQLNWYSVPTIAKADEAKADEARPPLRPASPSAAPRRAIPVGR